MYQVSRHSAYCDWFNLQKLKIQKQIEARLIRILDYGHFGDAKKLGPHLAELKWKSGLRIYFTIVTDEEGGQIVLLLGGNKNSQSKDISKSKKLLKEILFKDVKNEKV